MVYQIGRPGTRLRSKDQDFVSPSRIDRRFKGKLLRLCKNISSAVPVLESHEYFKNTVEPLFPRGMLIEQEICEVSPELLKKYNKELRQDEKHQYLRDRGRARTYLAEDDSHGILVTSMLWDDEHASCDFKPTWLTQSPSAPGESKRCRTCAMQAKHKKLHDFSTFCPLTLTSDDDGLLKRHLEGALMKMRGSPIYMLAVAVRSSLL